MIDTRALRRLRSGDLIVCVDPEHKHFLKVLRVTKVVISGIDPPTYYVDAGLPKQRGYPINVDQFVVCDKTG